MDTNGESLVLINAFEVPAGEDDDFIRSWEQARDYLSTQPGYISTALHQSVTPNADFRFVNIGRWASAEAFRAAVESPGFREAGRIPYPAHPALYRVVRT